MRHKVRDLGVFFFIAVILFIVTYSGKKLIYKTKATNEHSYE